MAHARLEVSGRDTLLRTARRHAPWLVPTLLTVLAGLLRIVGLGHPHELVFDETYYVKDAWTLLHLGYESQWPDGANESFLAGDTGVYSTDASFVVHPPLGKWIIALGLAVFGADSGWGWRIGTALVGTALVPLLYVVAKRLSGSIAVGGVAGLLLAIDSLAIAMSRVALLDGILAFFLLLGFWFVLLDVRDARARVLRDRTSWGPVVWARPWLVAAGAAFGAASAVKWSGLYALAGVGIGLVVVDALWRRRAGVREWYFSAILRQGPVTFLLLVPAAFVVYLVSWTGWLVTTGGYDRLSDANPLLALWNYHEGVYGFHVGLSTSHPYASPAWQWPLLLRPTAMWLSRPEAGTTTCGWSDDCIGVISSIPNPVVWYAGVAAAILLVWVLVRTRRARYAFPLAGLGVTYVPWLLYPERTVFQFYTIAMLPFLVLALVLALQHLVREREPQLLPDPTDEEIASATGVAQRTRRAWRVVVGVFLVVATLCALFYLPLALGIMEPYPLWQLHNWMTSWV
ncbi:phospholipid carrier-dependent glycosyltransferase [Microbacterium betulae]|uniref:Polyprenol-phosphate-mannose--protein mannosyltransferase n=1 Tax=Microbacterium betulae TaxID=2981139 RepID=A0AA97FJA5_9MICO|nr:phospholipid carrier-dependent glycosyltransferase [Microbacterium sp. AB]WOF24308.1 phospholipid carrier-dependent glycosyltransferase [Microbacterium sp. AB]